MLEKVKLHNFKSHNNTELNFDNSSLHALVGQNSSGKTSVLQALHYLSQLAKSSFANIFQYERAPQFIARIGQDNMSVTASGFWGNPDRNDWKASYDWRQTVNDYWSPRLSWEADKKPNSMEGEASSFMYAPEPIQQSLRTQFILSS